MITEGSAALFHHYDVCSSLTCSGSTFAKLRCLWPVGRCCFWVWAGYLAGARGMACGAVHVGVGDSSGLVALGNSNTRPHRGRIMPSVYSLSKQSGGPSFDLQESRQSRSSCRSPPRLPKKLARLFRCPDAAEEFMRDWLTRFHTEYPSLYTVLAARLVAVTAQNQLRRVVLEAARYKPQRPEATAQWLIIRWCVDGPGVVFISCPTRKVALDSLSHSLSERDIVYSSATKCSRVSL